MVMRIFHAIINLGYFFGLKIKPNPTREGDPKAGPPDYNPAGALPLGYTRLLE